MNFPSNFTTTSNEPWKQGFFFVFTPEQPFSLIEQRQRKRLIKRKPSRG